MTESMINGNREREVRALPVAGTLGRGGVVMSPLAELPDGDGEQHLMDRYLRALDEAATWRKVAMVLMRPYVGDCESLTAEQANDEVMTWSGDRPSLAMLMRLHERMHLTHTELLHAESKYPTAYNSTAECFGVIERELREAHQADQARDLPALAIELLQVAACAVRAHEFVLSKLAEDPEGNPQAALSR